MKKFKFISLLSFVSILSIGFVTSCGGNEDKPTDKPGSTCDNLHSYVDELKLTVDYTGKDFLLDGIGEVELNKAVDGDTAHFKTIDLKNGKPHHLDVKARFLGVDTPESTSSIEPWGHAASKFTKEKLNTATKIVLTSSFTTAEEGGKFGPAQQDSYGRSLAFIWVAHKENPELSDFKLLNLWLVQESYSGAKGTTQLGNYTQYFTDADIQASGCGLRIWSKDPDPDFNYGDATPCSILDIYTKMNEDTGLSALVGQKVTTRGVVTRVVGTSAYIQATYEPSEENGLTKTTTTGIYCFSNQAIKPISKIGNEVEITGTVSEFNGNYQLSGIKYNRFSNEAKDNTRVLQTGVKVEPVLVTTATQLQDLSGVLVEIKDLYCEAGDRGGYGGKHEWNKNTNSYNQDNDMSVYCNIGSDGTDNKTTLRIDGNVLIRDIEHPGLTVSSYKYFSGGTTHTGKLTYKRKKCNVIGVCEKYVTTSGRTTYQIKVCHNDDLTVEVIE